MATQPVVEHKPSKSLEVDANELAEQLVRDMMSSIEPGFSAMTNEERTAFVDDITAINDRSGAAPAR